MSLAVYPGSFDPPTIAHLAIVEAARTHVDEVRVVLSELALGKADLAGRTHVADRLAVLERVARTRPWLSAAVTPARLVADIATEAGADAVVMGADKWAQVCDPVWYRGSAEARDAALERLPRVLLARRAGTAIARPGSGPDVLVLDVDAALHDVSATRARAGERHLMLAEARATALW